MMRHRKENQQKKLKKKHQRETKRGILLVRLLAANHRPLHAQTPPGVFTL